MTAPRAHRQSGFTLIELMVVVTLLGIIALIAVPGFGNWMADSRTRQAAYDVLRLARRAQAHAFAEGVAWSLRYDVNGSNGHGAVYTYRGMTNRCAKVASALNRPEWEEALNNAKHGPQGEGLEMLFYNPSPSATPSPGDADRHVILAEVYYEGLNDPINVMEICYEPSGRVYAYDPGAGLTNLQTRRITFEIRRELRGGDHGMPRRVVFSPGGQARIKRGSRL